MRVLTIAALQIVPVIADPDATLARFEQRVEAARELFNGLQLVVAPELHLSASPPLLEEPEQYAGEVATTIPGPLTDRLAMLARQTRLWLVPGSVYERDADGRIRNTAFVVSPDGDLVAAYRKCFPWQPYETSAPGTRLVTFDIPRAGRVGLAICHDGIFPEVFRQLAWSGAELILQPTLTGTSDREAELVVARANAIVNQVHVVTVNAPSPVGNGRSAVFDPEGAVRYEAGAGEETLTVAIDFDAAARARTQGSFGMNRMWEQMDRHGPDLELPMYGGRYRPRPHEPDPAAATDGRTPQEVPTS
jgi:formamidase